MNPGVTHIVQEDQVQILAVANHRSALSHSKGFILVEFILYLAIVSVVILATAVFLQLIFASRVKSEVIAEVEQQGLQVMQVITQTIRNSSAINSPAEGNSSSSLSVDATVFDLSSGTIRITEGSGSPVNLTSSLVSAQDMTFQNLSYDSTPNTIRIQFTINYINTSGRNEYQFTKTFYGSANIRD